MIPYDVRRDESGTLRTPAAHVRAIALVLHSQEVARHERLHAAARETSTELIEEIGKAAE